MHTGEGGIRVLPGVRREGARRLNGMWEGAAKAEPRLAQGRLAVETGPKSRRTCGSQQYILGCAVKGVTEQLNWSVRTEFRDLESVLVRH